MGSMIYRENGHGNRLGSDPGGGTPAAPFGAPPAHLLTHAHH
jgi:hypothetical protein